jgi:hypothetical protein
VAKKSAKGSAKKPVSKKVQPKAKATTKVRTNGRASLVNDSALKSLRAGKSVNDVAAEYGLKRGKFGREVSHQRRINTEIQFDATTHSQTR